MLRSKTDGAVRQGLRPHFGVLPKIEKPPRSFGKGVSQFPRWGLCLCQGEPKPFRTRPLEQVIFPAAARSLSRLHEKLVLRPALGCRSAWHPVANTETYLVYGQ
jgi:hypothetical protein